MAHVLIVGAGGFVGSILRYWLSGMAQEWVQGRFPLGTLLVNVVGCFVIGTVWSLVEFRQWFSPELRAFLTFGILGGLTTFSAFGYETFEMLLDRRYWPALVYVGSNLGLGLGAVVLGWMAGKAMAL